MANLPESSAGTKGPDPATARGAAPASSAERVRRRWRLIALGAAVLFVLWLARDIIGPFLVAAVLAYAFSPVITAVENRTGAPRVLVIVAFYAIVLGAIGVLAVLAAERAGSELRELSSGGQDVIASALHKFFGDTITIAGQQLVVSDVAAQIRDSLLGLVKSPSSAVGVASRAVEVALQAILTMIVTFY